MFNSDGATRISATQADGHRQRLADAAIGRLVRVRGVEAEHRAELLAVGIDEGAEITLERRLALGGPLVVRLGRARLAIARAAAESVLVEDAAGREPPC